MLSVTCHCTLYSLCAIGLNFADLLSIVAKISTEFMRVRAIWVQIWSNGPLFECIEKLCCPPRTHKNHNITQHNISREMDTICGQTQVESLVFIKIASKLTTVQNNTAHNDSCLCSTSVYIHIIAHSFSWWYLISCRKWSSHWCTQKVNF